MKKLIIWLWWMSQNFIYFTPYLLGPNFAFLYNYMYFLKYLGESQTV